MVFFKKITNLCRDLENKLNSTESNEITQLLKKLIPLNENNYEKIANLEILTGIHCQNVIILMIYQENFTNSRNTILNNYINSFWNVLNSIASDKIKKSANSIKVRLKKIIKSDLNPFFKKKKKTAVNQHLLFCITFIAHL